MASGRFRIVSLAVVLLAVIAGALLYRSQRSVRVVRTAEVQRQEIHTGVITNGKAEPIEFREVRAELSGEVVRVLVTEGEQVRQGQRLLQISERQAVSELEQARAELAEAEDALQLLRQGGTAAEVRELRAQLEGSRRERDAAARQAEQNERLVEKGAVARIELEESRRRLAKAEADVTVLEEKLQKPYDPEALARAEARVEAARAALDVAQFRRGSAAVVAPLAGTVYSVAVRAGDHVNPGDVLVRVGDVSRIRVRVFVDEPDLGRVSAGQPVRITWDGLPGREWRGTVERLPSEVEELATRTVGQVSCTVENSSGELIANSNLNVEIVTES
jgi:HlyD family secretion protein